MPNTKINTILFDFFDVVHADHQKAWLKKNGYTREGEFAAASDDLDRGLIDIHEYFERYAQAHKEEVTPQDLREAFNELSVVDIDVVNLIIELRDKGYKTGLLTNTSSDELTPLMEKNGLFGLFDKVVISGDVGIAKPDPKIYYLIMKYMEIEPEHTFFTDDSQANVDIAIELGIESRLFTTAEQLRKDLEELKIL